MNKRQVFITYNSNKYKQVNLRNEEMQKECDWSLYYEGE